MQVNKGFPGSSEKPFFSFFHRWCKGGVVVRILFFAEMFQLLSQNIVFDVRVNFRRLDFRMTERGLDSETFRS